MVGRGSGRIPGGDVCCYVEAVFCFISYTPLEEPFLNPKVPQMLRALGIPEIPRKTPSGRPAPAELSATRKDLELLAPKPVPRKPGLSYLQVLTHGDFRLASRKL